MIKKRTANGNRRWILVTISIAAVGFSALFVAVVMQARQRTPEEISQTTQETWGRFLLEIYAPRRESPQAACVVRLQAIADSLTTTLHTTPVHVSVALDKKINAVSLPGRRVVVYDGLMLDVESENEIAMILAHEIGHHEANHILEAFGRRAFLGLASMGAGQIPVLGPILVQIGELGELSFSREAELEADRIGLRALHDYYGHVGGSTGFFERRLKEGEIPAAMELLSTHPLSEKRIESLKILSRNQGWEARPVAPALEPCPRWDRPGEWAGNRVRD